MKSIKLTKEHDSGYVHKEHETAIVKKQTWLTYTSGASDNELEQLFSETMRIAAEETEIWEDVNDLSCGDTPNENRSQEEPKL